MRDMNKMAESLKAELDFVAAKATQEGHTRIAASAVSVKAALEEFIAACDEVTSSVPDEWNNDPWAIIARQHRNG